MTSLKTLHGTIRLPAFFPDATCGVLRATDSIDILNSEITGLVVNTFHLLRYRSLSVIKAHGNIHNFMKFDKPIISDSGGFQVLSLVRKNKKFGSIHGDKIIFHLDGRKNILTPKKCIQIQLSLGSDIIMCLDDPARPEESLEEQKISVERTIKWAKQCKDAFIELTKNNSKKPLIFAIIQGGNNLELRHHCAKELVKIGFDGYGFGGWPTDSKGNFLTEILKFTAENMPDDKPKYAMGVGKPENIVTCVDLGYTIFDCVIPTRDARHKRLFIFKNTLKNLNLREDFYKSLYIDNAKFTRDTNPISDYCDCYTCKNYTRSYLHHLFHVKDTLAFRLATIHNLRFYARLMQKLQNQ